MKKFIAALSIFLLSSSELFAVSRCIAHRGFSSRYLENSMEAMIAALDIGSHGIELDIRHTKDGVPILLHDDNLRSVARSRGKVPCPLWDKVEDITFSDIRRKCLLKNGEEVPTLDELLKASKKYNAYLFIELKDEPSQQFFKVINSNIKSFEKVRFLSFKSRVLNRIKDVYPNSKTLLLSLIIPRGLGHTGADLPSKIAIALYRWIGGHETGIWTVNTVKKLAKAKKRKIDFITTDYPDLCLKL